MPNPLWKIKPTLVAPKDGIWIGPGCHRTTDGLHLGQLAELVTGKQAQVWLATSKEQVVCVVGKRGSGKSFTLGVIAEGLSLAMGADHVARKVNTRATLLFDPLDVYWTTRYPVSESKNSEAQHHHELAESAKLSGLTFNIEAWVPGQGNSRATDPSWFRVFQLPVSSVGLEEWELLLGVSVLTDPMGQALADALRLAGTTGYSRDGIKSPPVKTFDLNKVSDAVQSDELTSAYHSETLRALRQRLTSLDGTGLFSARGTGIDALLAPGRLSVVLLARLPQTYRAAVVALVTRMLVDARSQTAFAEKRLALDPTLSAAERADLEAAVSSGVPKTIVALDEAQTFLAPGQASVARDVFVRLVKEGRNIGLSAVLATQQPSALDQRVLSQVETFIAHQLVTEPDIQAVRANLKASLPDAIDYGPQQLDVASLLRMLPPGQCMVSSADMNTTVRRTFVMSVRPRATVHGGIEL